MTDQATQETYAPLTRHDERLESLARLNPDFFEAYAELASVPERVGALSPKLRDFIQLATHASTTSLHEPSIRLAIRSAVSHGATRDEILEVLEIASVLGIHTLTVGVPVLLDAMSDAGVPLPSGDLTGEQEILKAEFIENRGYWTDLWQQVLVLSPDYFTAYLRFSSVPWKQGHLEPKTKEFIYTAITASATHLFEPGIRVHMANAFGYGATAAELMELLQIVSLIGIHTMTVTVPLLEEELDRSAI